MLSHHSNSVDDLQSFPKRPRPVALSRFGLSPAFQASSRDLKVPLYSSPSSHYSRSQLLNGWMKVPTPPAMRRSTFSPTPADKDLGSSHIGAQLASSGLRISDAARVPAVSFSRTTEDAKFAGSQSTSKSSGQALLDPMRFMLMPGLWKYP